MAAKPLPSQETLRQLLDYDPDTGVLTWRVRIGNLNFNSRYAGKEAFINVTEKGYKRGRIANRLALAHRVIWKWMTGDEPQEIDHDDGDRANNKFINLKPADRFTNMHNMARSKANKSGVMGVCWDKVRRKWIASIRCNGKQKYLGHFVDLSEAAEARKRAEHELGYNPNHGRDMYVAAKNAA